MGIERERLGGVSGGDSPGAWKEWGPYLSERAWGTVREDYSSGGDAWNYFPHHEAPSRAYRWGEDGLAGVSDIRQLLCFGVALWNGRDPILKERIFGLAGPEGNHGEDAKEYWWYLDSTPTHSFMRWRYHYPQAEFPYQQLVEENARRDRSSPEFELLDTGIFDENRYFAVDVTYSKATPRDLCVEITVQNAGPDEAQLHLLPTLWFRNTWSWDQGTPRPRLSSGPAGPGTAAGAAASDGDAPAGEVYVLAEHAALGQYQLAASAAPDGSLPELLFCDNETNVALLYGAEPETPYPKDGISDHVLHGSATVNPAGEGTKAASWYQLTLAAGASATVRLRLTGTATSSETGNGTGTGGSVVAVEASAPAVAPPAARADLGDGLSAVIEARRREADEFYEELTPAGTDTEWAQVLRQAAAGLLWSKQFYCYDVVRWLEGDPGEPPPPAERRSGRNAGWIHFDAADILSMPDKWEYPWFAAWDLAFHCVVLARLDPEMAKHQMLLLCREWYMHPNGQLPAYEWDFGDVNPPVHAWAAMRIFEIDGGTDYDFLERIFHKLLINFTWWVNREDSAGNNAFQGGFLGLDNIGPFDRSAPLPVAGLLEQADGTAWMAMYCLNLLDMALVLAARDSTYEDVATKFLEHFAYIATALDSLGLWDEEDGFYYDLLRLEDGSRIPLRVRSMVGLVPLFGVATMPEAMGDRFPGLAARASWFIEHKPDLAEPIAHLHDRVVGARRMLSAVGTDQLRRILERAFDENEFLSPLGLRSVSAVHREHPMQIELGGQSFSVDYEPGESRVGLFGGNSNWRGPLWFPPNFLFIEALERYHRCLGEEFKVELPTGSGTEMTLAAAASELRRRMVSLFCRRPDGLRPIDGGVARLGDERWRDLIVFNEYFHGDSGAGLGASHQTGWTALVVDMILSPPA